MNSTKTFIQSVRLFLLTLLFVSLWGVCSASPQQQPKPGTFPISKDNFKTYNETILQLDLSKEINFKGRVLRMHYITLAPNGVIGQHSHANRPTIEYVLHGTATETKRGEDGKVVVKSVPTGETELSTVGIEHWWKNDSRTMVKIMAVDIWVDDGTGSKICRPQGNPRVTPLQPPSNPDKIKTEDMGSVDLSTQFPEIVEAKDYVFRSRRLTIFPGQKTEVVDGTGNPSITYVVAGEVWENRSDEASSIRRTGEYSVANNGIQFYWENTTVTPVILWTVDIVKKPGL